MLNFHGWVTLSQRVSAVSGSKVPKSRSDCRGHCRLTLAFWFRRCDVSSRRYAVSSAEVARNENVMFLFSKFVGRAPEICVGHL